MRLLLTILGFFLITTFSTYSQRISIGPNIGLNYNFLSKEYDDIGSIGDASGFGMLAGAQVEFMFSPIVGIVANLQFYDNRSASVDYNYEDRLTRINTNNQQQIYNVEVTGDGNTSLSYFTIEALVKLAVPGGLFFTLGPAIGINTSATDEWDTVIEFVDFNQREDDEGSEDIKEPNTRFEIKAGIGYDISLGSGMILAPHVGFAYGFGDIRDMDNEGSWTISTIQAMVTYKFVLGN